MTRAQLEQMVRFNTSRVVTWGCEWPRQRWTDAAPWLVMLLPWALLVAVVVWR